MVGFRKAGHLLENSLCSRCEMIQGISEEGKYATASWLKQRPPHAQVRPQTFSDPCHRSFRPCALREY